MTLCASVAHKPDLGFVAVRATYRSKAERGPLSPKDQEEYDFAKAKYAEWQGQP